jgi:hypothetical protein
MDVKSKWVMQICGMRQGSEIANWRVTLLLLSLWSFNVHPAESELRLEVDHVDWSGGMRAAYDVFDPGEYAQTIDFKVRLIGDPCPFFVTFGSVSGMESQRRASRGGDQIDYQIYDSVARRTALRELPAATASEVLRGAFRPGEEIKDLSYVIVVPPGQLTRAGLYNDPIKITVYQGEPEDFIEQDSKTVLFSIRVDPVTELSLGESGATFDPKAKSHRLDFGTLTKGKAGGFDLRIRSNAGYHVTLESEHGGVMKHVDPRVAGTIPYVLRVDGAPTGLGRDQQVSLSRRNRLTDSSGDRHELSVIIGAVGGAAAGTYQDNLTVSVVADQ